MYEHSTYLPTLGVVFLILENLMNMDRYLVKVLMIVSPMMNIPEHVFVGLWAFGTSPFYKICLFTSKAE